MTDVSMLELFRAEVEQQVAALGENLLALDNDPNAHDALEAAMRAAHSIKGAARLVGIDPVVRIAHVMEDRLVAAQNGAVTLSPDDIDPMLKGMDLIVTLAQPHVDIAAWGETNKGDIDALVVAMEQGGRASDPQAGAATASGLEDMSMADLFKVESEQQTKVLNEGLLALEQDPTSSRRLEPLMRAAHSIKGAARLVGLQAVVELAHKMEDGFVAAQNGAIVLSADHLDVLLDAVDTIQAVAANVGGLDDWLREHSGDYENLIQNLDDLLQGLPPSRQRMTKHAAGVRAAESVVAVEENVSELSEDEVPRERVLRVSADQVNRMMGLAGEAVVESRWLYPFAGSLQRLKRKQTELVTLLDHLREHLGVNSSDEAVLTLVRDAQRHASACRETLADRLTELEQYDRQAGNLSSRLHREVVQSRMRPFGDGMHGFPRMVRDVARALGKEVQLVIDGEETLVDRDVLDKIEAPLNHILRNAIDHGIESPEARMHAGKPKRGTIRLSATHQAGMLSVVVADDGQGVDVERLRRKVRDKGLVDETMAAQLSEAELLEFLFLPSFSTREQVSEISGRGVGLDVVQDAVQEMRGSVRLTSTWGQGAKFHLQLPLTLSVITALLVEIGGEPYAFALARTERILKVERREVREVEGNQFIAVNDRNIGLVSGAQVMGVDSVADNSEGLPVVVVSERGNSYGLVVDRLIGERDLVVHQLPAHLGKVQDISAAAITEDGVPLLIVDTSDLVRTIEKTLKVARIGKVSVLSEEQTQRKRILVVDDSITVREVERKLLEAVGYVVDVAVDGMDGLNALHSDDYDLLITDVDMPRMNGIELARSVRRDPRLKNMPIMMVSYKDREGDRLKGIEAGADYYLAKGSFHDESLRNAVAELIGKAFS